MKRSYFVVAFLLVIVGVGSALIIKSRLGKRYELLYNKGVLLMRTGDLEEAEGFLRAALERKPDLMQAQRALIDLALRARDYDKALTEIARAEEMGYPKADGDLLRAEVVLGKAQFEFDKAQGLLDKVIEIGPDRSDPDEVETARELLAQLRKAPVAAQEHLPEAIAYEEDVLLLDFLLDTYINWAIEIVRQAADEASSPAEAYTRLGGIYQKEMEVLAWKHGLAIKERDRKLASGSTEEAYEAEAEAEAAFPAVIGAKERAIAAYRHAMEIDPTLDLPRLELAKDMINAPRLNLEGVHEVLAPVVEQNPHHAEARRLLSKAERRSGNYEEAVEQAQMAGEGDVNTYQVIAEQAQAYIAAGQWDRAIPLGEKLFDMQPTLVQSLYLSSKALLHEEREDRERDALDAAANRLQNLVTVLEHRANQARVSWPEQRTQLLRARFALAEALYRKENLAQAETEYRRVATQAGKVENTDPELRMELLEMRQKACEVLASGLASSAESDALEQFAAEAELTRGQLLATRAQYRLRRAGENVDAELCDSILKEEIEPAIEAINPNVAAVEDPALAYVTLGDVLMQKSDLLGLKIGFIRNMQAEEDPEGNQPADASALLIEGKNAFNSMRRAQSMALGAYKRAMGLDPDLDVPRLRIARHMLVRYSPDAPGAVSLLQPIIDRTPEHRQARELMVVAERLQGDYDAALEHLGHVRQVGSNAVVGTAMKAEIFADAERWAEARETAEELVGKDPDNRRFVYLYAQAVLHTAGPEDAGVLEDALGRLQDSASGTGAWPGAHFVIGEGLRALGRTEEAASAYQRVLEGVSQVFVRSLPHRRELMADRYGACMALADLASAEDLKAAASYATEAVRTMPQKEQALAKAKKLHRLAGTDPAVVEDLVLLHVLALPRSGDPKAAVRTCDREIDEDWAPDGSRRLYLAKARILFGMGDYQEAATAYESLWKQTGDAVFGHELASLHRRLGHVEEAESIYEQLIETNPDDERALILLSLMRAHAGNIEGAKAILTEAAERLGSGRFRAVLLRVYLESGDIDQAVELIRAQLDADPDSIPYRLVLAELLWRTNEPDEARAEFDKVLEAAPRSPVAYRRGILDLQQGRYEEASELYRQAESMVPDLVEADVCLALAAQSGGNPTEAIAMLNEAVPDSRVPAAAADAIHWYLAVLYAGNDNMKMAEEHNKSIDQTEIGPYEDRHALLLTLNGLPDAIRHEAAASLNRLVLFVRAQSLQGTVQELDHLAQVMPDEPLTACMYARLLESEGRHEEAVERLEDLATTHPDMLFIRTQLASSYVRHGDLVTAVEVLEDAVRGLPLERTARVHLSIGSHYERMERWDAAAQSYRRATELPETAAIAYNNLAMLLADKKGDLLEAMRMAREAKRLAPSSPHILDTAGWVSFLHGDYETALRDLETARRLAPAHPTIRYHLGAAYVKAGRVSEGRRELEQALVISPDFEHADDARRMLESL